MKKLSVLIFLLLPFLSFSQTCSFYHVIERNDGDKTYAQQTIISVIGDTLCVNERVYRVIGKSKDVGETIYRLNCGWKFRLGDGWKEGKGYAFLSRGEGTGKISYYFYKKQNYYE